MFVRYLLTFCSCCRCWLSPQSGFPAGTTLDVRQNTAMGTRQSRPGSPVQATLIAPVVLDGQTVIPAGARLNGSVTMVRKLGLGIKHHNASMELRFNSLTLASGESLPIETRLVDVDTARESVDQDGRIIGIRPTANVFSSLATFAWRFLLVNPHVGVPLWLGKLAFVRTPDPELNFPAGTELRLQLTRQLDIESAAVPAHAPTECSQADHAEEFRQIIAETPGATCKKNVGRGFRSDQCHRHRISGRDSACLSCGRLDQARPQMPQGPSSAHIFRLLSVEDTALRRWGQCNWTAPSLNSRFRKTSTASRNGTICASGSARNSGTDRTSGSAPPRKTSR